DGHAIFNIPTSPDTTLTGLEISFGSEGLHGQKYQIVINDRPVASGTLQESGAVVRFDLTGREIGTELIVEILSSKSVEGSTERGVPLSSIVMGRQRAQTQAGAWIGLQGSSGRTSLQHSGSCRFVPLLRCDGPGNYHEHPAPARSSGNPSPIAECTREGGRAIA